MIEGAVGTLREELHAAFANSCSSYTLFGTHRLDITCCVSFIVERTVLVDGVRQVHQGCLPGTAKFAGLAPCDP